MSAGGQKIEGAVQLSAPTQKQGKELIPRRLTPTFGHELPNGEFASLPMCARGLVRSLHARIEALCAKKFDELFAEVDDDENRRLDPTEVHVAVLIVYGNVNQSIPGLSLEAPNAHHVKAMCAAAHVDGDGCLGPEEFRNVFMRTFLRGMVLRVAAHLVVEKVFAATGVVFLQLLAGYLLRRARLSRIPNKISAVMPIVYYQITSSMLRRFRLEQRLGRALGADSSFDDRT